MTGEAETTPADASEGTAQGGGEASGGAREGGTPQSSVDALEDYRSLHRKQYEDRLRREAEEEEKAKRIAEEQKGYEVAARLQQEEESILATRMAADAEMSRQLFAQLNRHVQPAVLADGAPGTGAAPAQGGASVGTAAGAYSTGWYEQLRLQQEQERRVQEGYSAFPPQSDDDNVRPPMRTNYTERLIDDSPVGWGAAGGGYSESLLGQGGSDGGGGFSWIADILRGTFGIPDRAGAGEVLSPAERAHRRRRAIYIALVCVFMIGPLAVALMMLISQAMQ
ncbi:hypothetical protein BESB_001270 [Besnoitia besnoiti]|uniref:Transmembrane protein n=1 Tax=Besnoitia besnoiti TaxID=94643 RepID=A0A2A9MIH1_BESBE|nr:hypothetical protein BESB_001270 [Besnoitia besnoiti]PFH37785.1 hypothetical protein BESB_001270 [Besnoitia besnoiti]